MTRSHSALSNFAADLERARKDRTPTMALRRHSDGTMDDTVVDDVTCFRAEQLDKRALWMACYFPNGERVTFHVQASKGTLTYDVDEMPEKWVDRDKRRVREGADV